MALELPRIFPQILSQVDPSPSPAITLQGADLTSTNAFLMNFHASPETGTIGFSTVDGEDRRLTRENADELRLSALAVTLDAWRILHRTIIESPATRDEVFGRMQANLDVNHALWSTRGEWKIKSYSPNLSPLPDLTDRVFTDGQTAPMITGRVCLTHATRRVIDVTLYPPELGLYLAIGWSGEETEVRQFVLVNEQEAYTAGYFLSFAGQALKGVQACLQSLDRSGRDSCRLEFSMDRARLRVANTAPQANPFPPLPEELQGPLWNRALEPIFRKWHV